MMSSEATSSPVSASTLAYLMRWPVLRLIWLKLTFSVSDVAGYSATGQVTSERRKKPFQLARGAIGILRNATDDGDDTTAKPGFQRTGADSPNGVIVAGRRACPGTANVGGGGRVAPALYGCGCDIAAAETPGTSFGIRRFSRTAR